MNKNIKIEKILCLNVLIIGCGNIAGFLEIKKPSEKRPPITHAGAFSKDSRFKIKACVEPNVHQREKFMKFWEIKTGYDDISQISIKENYFDVISVCSPNSHHFEHLTFALKLRPKVVFAEKPLTENLSEAKIIIEKYKKAKIKLIVNHTRRWDKSVEKFKFNLIKNKWGILRSINGVYNKGIMNNGIHLIDLLNFLVGEMDILFVGNPIHDYFDNDPSVPFMLKTKKGVNINVNCGHAGDFDIFEVQFIFSRGVVVMESGGSIWVERNIENSKYFHDYKSLGVQSRRKGTNILTFSNAISNIFNSIKNDEKLKSSAETAIIAQTLCNKIKKRC